jgi:transposase
MIIFPDLPDIEVEGIEIAEEITLTLRTVSPGISDSFLPFLAQRYVSCHEPASVAGINGIKGIEFLFCGESECNVHHLRELTFIEEELKQAWAGTMKELLLDMKAEKEQAQALGQHELDVLVLARLLSRYDELLAEGYLANPPPPPRKTEQGKRKPGRAKQNPARNLLDRFSASASGPCCASCSILPSPFDNNQAERDLRMMKAQQKVSSCFRTELGIAMFCRIRSYLSTLHKQSIHPFPAFQQNFAGHPPLPAFT